MSSVVIARSTSSDAVTCCIGDASIFAEPAACLERSYLLTVRSRGHTISVTDVFMAKPQSTQELLPLTPPVFHILLALADEERHGYGIMQDVARQTDDALQLGPGTLYGCLKRMLAAGLVEESDERPDPALDDERRRYYRMTALGKRAVRAEAQRLTSAVMADKTKLAGEIS